MSTPTPQTKEQALATKERFRFRFILAVIILFAFIVSMVLGWLGILKPSAAMSDGKFCIQGTYIDGGQTGRAGGKLCEVKPDEPEAPAAIVHPISSRTPGCVSMVGILGVNNPGIRIDWKADNDSEITSDRIQVVRFTGTTTTVLAASAYSTTGDSKGYTTVIRNLPMSGFDQQIGIRIANKDGDSRYLVAHGTLGALGMNGQCSMSSRES